MTFWMVALGIIGLIFFAALTVAGTYCHISTLELFARRD